MEGGGSFHSIIADILQGELVSTYSTSVAFHGCKRGHKTIHHPSFYVLLVLLGLCHARWCSVLLTVMPQ